MERLHVRFNFRILQFCVLGLFCGMQQGMAQQTARTTALAPSGSCSVTHFHPTDADTAYTQHKYSEAGTMYRATLTKNSSDPAAMTGLVLTLLAQNKGTDALTIIQKYAKTNPDSSVAQGLLGQVHMRLGDMRDVITYLNQAIYLDPCNAWAHFQASHFLYLAGMYASAKSQLDTAYLLAPDNAAITKAWEDSNPPTLKPEERIAELKKKLEAPDLSADEHDALLTTLNELETNQHGDCQLMTPFTQTTEKLIPMRTDLTHLPPATEPLEPLQIGILFGVGLDLQINGKHRHFQVDTGASGLTLSRSVALAAGLTSEMESKLGGIGDKGLAASYVAHVDDIRIGTLEFKNCMVQVIENNSGLTVDGLIGTDVFKNYLITLDIPRLQMKLDPLPRRPGDPIDSGSLDTATDMQSMSAPHDRYIAPEMKDWTKIYRVNDQLIVPTQIGNAPPKLFILDSGASVGLITPEAATQVSKVATTDAMKITGIGGEVKNVAMANRIEITFAGVRQVTKNMVSIDTTNVSDNAGVEISGFIGFPTLRDVTLSLDYRDNLIHVSYDPKHILK